MQLIESRAPYSLALSSLLKKTKALKKEMLNLYVLITRNYKQLSLRLCSLSDMHPGTSSK